jgi:hypothetical protein
VIPNGSVHKYSPTLDCWVALHKFFNGETWVVKQLQSGKWGVFRKATDADIGALLRLDTRRMHNEWPT